MRLSFLIVALARLVLSASVSLASTEQAPHSPGEPHDTELGHRHQHRHASHPHLTHPIVTESPLPEDQFRISASYARVGDFEGATVEASFEKALLPNLGVELAVPFTYVHVDGEGSEERLDNIEVALKYADYQFGDRGVVLGAGLELGLPTGDAGAGIGSDRTLEVEPYVAAALRRDRFEAIGVLRLGLPLNEPADEADDVDAELAADLSLMYHLSPRLAALVELNGSTVLAGEADESVLFLNPGVSVAPFESSAFRVGVGVGVPVAGDSDVDFEVRLMTIWHF